MTAQPPASSVPPIEPTPVVASTAVPPPTVDPYAQPAPPPPPPPYAPAAYAPTAYSPAYSGGYYGAPQPPKGLAIASLVTGIAGAFFSLFYGLGLFPSIAAVITGHLARKRQPYARGFWIAGLITGYVGLGISVLWIVGIIIFFVFVAANPSYFDTGSLGTGT
jgi:hypothetical protein